MHRRSLIISAATVALLPSTARAATGGDTSVFERSEVAGANKLPQRVFYHRPAAWRENERVVMVLHGVGRNAVSYRDDWIAQADHYGFLLICPEFSQSKFPGAAWYSQGGLRRTKERQLWSFAVPDRVFTDARKHFAATTPRYSLYGHSAGGQFVHRMMLLAPSTSIDRAIAANAGFYTLPVFDTRYPYGLAGTEVSEAQVADFLRLPLVVLLGEADTNPNHPELVRNAQADKQGLHRYARGMHFMEVGKREAARRDIAFGWRVATVPGAGHSNRRMAAGAAAQLFT